MKESFKCDEDSEREIIKMYIDFISWIGNKNRQHLFYKEVIKSIDKYG